MKAFGREDMLAAIAKTLTDAESIEIRVTNARGRTLVHHYAVTKDGARYVRHSWNGNGNLRDEYKRRVLSQQ